MTALTNLNTHLNAHCLQALGHCMLMEEDGLSGTLVLIGPDEPRFWSHFAQSDEFSAGMSDPLDRWSKRVLAGVADALDCQAVFPSDGPPFHPFFTWALRTGRFWASPIGFLVHDTMGLFASFRGALILPGSVAATPGVKPCNTCAAQPCVTACPVGAFADGYDVQKCKAHLSTPQGADCITEGCRARRACPVGKGNRLPAQAAFHMKAFL